MVFIGNRDQSRDVQHVQHGPARTGQTQISSTVGYDNVGPGLINLGLGTCMKGL